MKIPANRLDRAYEKHKEEYETKALHVLRSGNYILGSEVAAFESEFSAYLDAKYCISLANGSDALWVALHLLNIGPSDEVIVQGNAFFATVLAITRCGARPVFAEPDLTHYNLNASNIAACITSHTKAVLVTHLYGLMTPMHEIINLCRTHGLRLIEDCAQAHDARFQGQAAGTFGDVGCFSFYPTKNLGAFGDGGALVTNDPRLAENAYCFRNYGKENNCGDYIIQGVNSRLDELQAALLRIRLQYLKEDTAEKNHIAKRYYAGLRNEWIDLPKVYLGTENVWHQFVIRCNRRQDLIAYLLENGIETAIHYPIPPHLTSALRNLRIKRGALPITEQLAETVLSLPSFFGLREDEQDFIIRTLNQFS